MQLAEPSGAEALCPALHVLVIACRANSDLDGAWQAATRYLEAAATTGGHTRLFYATWAACGVALARRLQPGRSSPREAGKAGIGYQARLAARS